LLRTLPYHVLAVRQTPNRKIDRCSHAQAQLGASLATGRSYWHRVARMARRARVRASRAPRARQESIVYRRVYEAALGASLWSTTHDTFIVTILASVLEVLLIAVHSLPLHYRPK
jgi:hypothetical protein